MKTDMLNISSYGQAQSKAKRIFKEISKHSEPTGYGDMPLPSKPNS